MNKKPKVMRVNETSLERASHSAALYGAVFDDRRAHKTGQSIVLRRLQHCAALYEILVCSRKQKPMKSQKQSRPMKCSEACESQRSVL